MQQSVEDLRLYGGMGSFADVGSEVMDDAVGKLRVPLVRARTFGFE